jgi:hypothetical protein
VNYRSTDLVGKVTANELYFITVSFPVSMIISAVVIIIIMALEDHLE